MEAELEKQDEESKNYIYIYGIMNKKGIKLNIRGLNNKPIQEIKYKDIHALTSPYPILNPILNEDEAVRHSNILKRIAKKTTIIPMAFGMVFKDQEILEIILSKSYQAIKQTLDLIDGKIELGVKVVKKQFDYANNRIAQEIISSLDKLSVKSVAGDKFSDRLLINHSFLVEKQNFSKFSNEIAKLENEYKDLNFIYTGPWPPYSFVSINIKGS